ncbi:MAG: DEAD/DEAH box helicase [Candidatus Heimdallarchaeota archaeon]
MKVADLDLPRDVRSFIETQDGIPTLYPPQAQAIAAGLLDGQNLVLAIPTASGKTLVGELCALKHILDQGGKAVYLCPLRALASEKYHDFKRFEPLGVSVAMSSGDYDSADHWLSRYDLIITTNEKMDAMLRHGTPWFDEITLIVTDEIHLITEPDRGPTLETLITKVRINNPQAQILALSATIQNGQEIADWLEAALVESTWRPIPLKEGYFMGGTIVFPGTKNNALRPIQSPSSSPIAPATWMAIDIVRAGGQALLFATSRKRAASAAKKVGAILQRFLTGDEKKALRELQVEFQAQATDPLSEKLAAVIPFGVAFHHAGLGSTQRKLVEDAFRNNVLKIVTATPTLAAGVNLPARRVIIDSVWRYSSGGQEPISVIEYKQQAGRAGRPQYDTYGEAVLIARSAKEGKWLTSRYIQAEAEEVSSKLATDPALRQHLLGLIASKVVTSTDSLDAFLRQTLLFNQVLQFDPEFLKERVEKILAFLAECEFIIIGDRGELKATKYGTRVSQLYIDPLSANIIKEGLEKAREERVMGGVSPFIVLHLVAATPDLSGPFVRKNEFSLLETIVEEREEEFLKSVPEPWSLEFEFFLGQVKTALILQEWITEIHLSQICSKFDVGSGDVARLVETAQWLLYATAEIARILRHPSWIYELTKKVHLRVQYGVTEPLLELCRLKGIGRVRSRSLYAAGITSISTLGEILAKNPVRIVRIPGFGTELLKDLETQVSSDQGAPETQELVPTTSILAEEALIKPKTNVSGRGRRQRQLDSYVS